MNFPVNLCVYKCPYGDFFLAEQDGKLTHLVFDAAKIPTAAVPHKSDVLLKTEKQLDEYFAGKRKVFDIETNPSGTSFQKKVWQALAGIPYGETTSYAAIAKICGSPKAYRAVGGANNKNPISVIVPCHRVVGTSGELTGYGGGLPLKEALLALEQKNKTN